jgi:hypothetical protein
VGRDFQAQKPSNAQNGPQQQNNCCSFFLLHKNKVRRKGRPTMCVEQMANLLDDQKLGEKANEDQIHIIVYVRE